MFGVTYVLARLLRGAVVLGVEPADGVGEQGAAPWHHLHVLLHALQPPPGGVAAVVARVRPAAEQVRDEAVAERRREGEEKTARVAVTTGEEEAAAHRDERVAAPDAKQAGGEVGQA